MKNYYTEEERKNDFYWECEYFGFTSNYELSKPIKITQLFSIIPEKYQTQLMILIHLIENMFHPKLKTM